MRKHPDLRTLKKDTLLEINPKEDDRVIRKFAEKGIRISNKDIVKFAGVTVLGSMNVEFNGVVTGPYARTRFFIPELKGTKEEILLAKIDLLWKRQPWYTERYATEI